VTLFKGHRRPISSLDISPLDKTMVTSSQDSTIKLWSLQDGSCLQTLESNTPPLCVSFLASGLQLVATTLSGLLQLWTIRDSGCVVFESVHEDKIWSMDVDGEWVVTGSAEDAAVVLWRDKSMEHKEQELEKQDFLVEK
jgi:U3 small nucleolar RNA-associated protein 13